MSAATTFSVRFLGCKVSQADAALIRDALRDAGHVETVPEAADVHVVNTCALTVEAERKSRREANRGARRGRVFVSGCAVNLNAAQFGGPGVTTLPGSADRAAAEIVELLGGGRTTACADDAPRAPGRTRAFLKVQNGCDSECAFCIIPTTRGRAESRPMARILAEGRRRIDEGHPELVLTGINIGTFRDPGSGADLADLVRAVGRLEGLRRLRISSIEPGDVADRLLDAMAATPVVAPHLHVPLQSGDPGVLRAMRRSYGVGEYLDACRRAAAAVPGLNLTTDAIVGFPGEDEAAFRGHGAGRRGAVDEQDPRLPVLPAPRHRRRGDGGAPGAGRAARAGRGGCATSPTGSASPTAPVASAAGPGAGGAAATRTGRSSGLGADYTRFVLPAGAGAPGEMVAVAVAGRRRRAPRRAAGVSAATASSAASRPARSRRRSSPRRRLPGLRGHRAEGAGPPAGDPGAPRPLDRRRRRARRGRAGGDAGLHRLGRDARPGSTTPATAWSPTTARTRARASSTCTGTSWAGRRCRRRCERGRAQRPPAGHRARGPGGRRAGGRAGPGAARARGAPGRGARPARQPPHPERRRRTRVRAGRATWWSELAGLVRAGRPIEPGTDRRGGRRGGGGPSRSGAMLDDVVWRNRQLGRDARARPARSATWTRSARSTITFGIGPAGTGKTYLAVAIATAALTRREVGAHHPHPARRGGRRAARLPARRPGGQGRPLPAPAVRRALRHARRRARRGAVRPRPGRGGARSPSCAAAPSTTASSSSTRPRTRPPSRCRCS